MNYVFPQIVRVFPRGAIGTIGLIFAKLMTIESLEVIMSAANQRNPSSLHIAFLLMLSVTLNICPAFPAGSPCELFTPSDLEKLSVEQQAKVREAIRECERKQNEQKKEVTVHGLVLPQNALGNIEYTDERGTQQIYRNQDMRAAFPERGSPPSIR